MLDGRGFGRDLGCRLIDQVAKWGLDNLRSYSPVPDVIMDRTPLNPTLMITFQCCSGPLRNSTHQSPLYKQNPILKRRKVSLHLVAHPIILALSLFYLRKKNLSQYLVSPIAWQIYQTQQPTISFARCTPASGLCCFRLRRASGTSILL